MSDEAADISYNISYDILITGAGADLGLSMDACRGQCYDGAVNMSGRLNEA